MSLYFILISTQIQFSQCSISFQWFTYHSCSFISNIVPCSYFSFYHYHLSFLSLSSVLHYHLYLSFHSFILLCSSSYYYSFHSLHFSYQPRFSIVKIVLVFNDSLIISAPDSPILFSVHIFHFIIIIYHFHLSLSLF